MRLFNPFAPRDSAVNAVASARIKDWTRAALGLDDGVRVLVHELACSRPNCPPRETVILVVPVDAPPFKIALHKTMQELTEVELSLAWGGHGPPP
ncbi:hypothetical protein [Kaistia terrae]|uniref:Nitrate reductase n=1 Tax=Kaistia terrae TaxID=537017 RepID=A0ABW0PVM6_9HYPH|nr:hypothetical protein [Kaistia terrae]MCX5576740.1 hypothetical protein [Kaistia terrae]